MVYSLATSNEGVAPRGATLSAHNSDTKRACPQQSGRVRYDLGEALYSTLVASHLVMLSVEGFALSASLP